MSGFEGKAALVTGAASGIGAATARRLTRAGASVVLADIDAEAVEMVAADIRATGGRAVSRAVDVGVEAEITGAIADAVETFGGLDILINNAGVGAFARVGELTTETWRRVFAIDLDAVFFACRAAMPHLARRRGAIVNTASISGIAADYGFAAYNAAKAGVINLTRAIAIDYAGQGVRANSVSPGFVATTLTTALQSHPRIREDYGNLIPLGRPSEPDEQAAAIVFLASSDASYITGTNLVVDGGLTAATGQPNFFRILSTASR